LSFEYLRPLRRTAPGQFCQRVAAGRANQPCELTAFGPRRVKHFNVADAIGKDHAVAVPVEAVVSERLLRPFPFGSWQYRPVNNQPVHETVAHGRELDKAAAPKNFVAKRFRVEAHRHLATVADADANTPGHNNARRMEYSAHDRA